MKLCFSRVLWAFAFFGLILSGCATSGKTELGGTGMPIMRVDDAGDKVHGKWTDPRVEPVAAYDKVVLNQTTLAELVAMGFGPEARVVGGTLPKNKDERKALEVKVGTKPVRLEGSEAYKLYMQMLFPEGGSSQAITLELVAQRETEVPRYVGFIFVIDKVKTKTDRFYFSTKNIFKIGYIKEFKFVLRDGIVVQKSKKEEDFNDPKTEKSFGKGVYELFKGIKDMVPSIIPF